MPEPESSHERKTEAPGEDLRGKSQNTALEYASSGNCGQRELTVVSGLEGNGFSHDPCAAYLPESRLQVLHRLSEFLNEKEVLLQQGLAELNLKGIPTFVPSIFLREAHPGALQPAEPDIIEID
jgi:hypothetical protein